RRTSRADQAHAGGEKHGDERGESARAPSRRSRSPAVESRAARDGGELVARARGNRAGQRSRCRGEGDRVSREERRRTEDTGPDQGLGPGVVVRLFPCPSPSPSPFPCPCPCPCPSPFPCPIL